MDRRFFLSSISILETHLLAYFLTRVIIVVNRPGYMVYYNMLYSPWHEGDGDI